MQRPKQLGDTRVYVANADPKTAVHVRELLGFLDGYWLDRLAFVEQMRERLPGGERAIPLTRRAVDAQLEIAMEHMLARLPSAELVLPVFATDRTGLWDIVNQAIHLHAWDVGGIALPATVAGVAAARELVVREGVPVVLTSCCGQEQAAAVHVATRDDPDVPVAVSVPVGLLDDDGYDGLAILATSAKCCARRTVGCASSRTTSGPRSTSLRRSS